MPGWPTVADVLEVCQGRELSPGAASSALAAAIEETEERTGWRPLWSPPDVVWTQRIVRAVGSVIELPRPCQSVEEVTIEGSDPPASLDFVTIDDGRRVQGLELPNYIGGLTLVAACKGGAFPNVPADLRLAVAIRAAQLASVDVSTLDASKLTVGGLSVELRPETWFDLCVRRWARIVV